MYKNIGSKIKLLAKILFILTALVLIIIGIALLVDQSWLFGVLCLLLGPVIAWVMSWQLYGFGELVDKVSEIAAGTPKSNTEKKIVAEASTHQSEPSENFKLSLTSSGIMDIPKRNKEGE